MLYKVMECSSEEGDLPCGEFANLADAKRFILAKLADRQLSSQEKSYRIFHGDTFLEELFQSAVRKMTVIQKQTQLKPEEEPSSTIFKPTPFNTKPVPSGFPHGCIVDKEEDSD